ncbi:MAG: hypothetical protein WAW85_14830 [Gordonia sp. (in: high G+C Gram-positive bacteria)]|uniref:hypothetical protein n=1 Tax=Gordonia sp. (in: high G+C Gram-positive bacteria) TaxID=84139 RepID=UPI003BB6DD4E
MSDQTAPATETAVEATPSPTAGVVGSIRRYVAAEGGASTAILQPTGVAGVRITLIGEKNGLLGDRVVASLDEAKAVVAQVEGLEIADEWDRELTNKVTIAPSHWRKMAGWVAHQTRGFPRARNRKVVDYR